MYKIYKMSLSSPVNYAAEELKKYLRMMMPEGEEIIINDCPDTNKGFRLGLMQDFGLDISDVEDPVLDDILFIDANEDGGVIAGDNPRSVLLAVYEYLRQQGCRWLFPGVDGEYIPVVDGLKPVQYRHVPSCRYRGQCNEGSEFQSNMLEAIEFAPKVGMNVFMMEFRIPTSYYKRYYKHTDNEMNRAPEPVSDMTILQWKRQCEAELTKRGLQFHDIGHGWGADSFGIDSSVRATDGDNEALVSEEARQYLALVKGKRALFSNTPNYTQFCMSNQVARKKVVQYAADYAQRHRNVDYLHLWLGDGFNGQCECEECLKKIPSDWYMILLNELDEELTRRKLDTRITFIAYADTLWPPVEEKIEHQERFSLLISLISRDYTKPAPEMFEEQEIVPYVTNQMEAPNSLEKTITYFNKWKEMWKGTNLAYEYHFWRHQYYDLGGIALANVVHQDVKAYKKQDINGVIEDGSQRSFFPTGLAFYTYARTLFDNSLSLEEIIEDYFLCAFGEDWKQIYDYLKTLGEVFDFRYLEGKNSANPERSAYYNPEHASNLANIDKILEKGKVWIKGHYNMPYRIQTVSVRLLEMHAMYAKLLAEALIPKTKGNDDEADRLFDIMIAKVGEQEVYFQTCYDQGLAIKALRRIFAQRTKVEESIFY